MRFLLLILSIVALLSCDKVETTVPGEGLPGIWKMTEIKMDPGNGKGEWHAAGASEEIITFDEKLNFTSTKGLFGRFPQGSSYEVKTDSVMSFYNTRKIDTLNVAYGLSGLTLDIYLPCREACGLRFSKIK